MEHANQGNMVYVNLNLKTNELIQLFVVISNLMLQDNSHVITSDKMSGILLGLCT